VDKLAETALPPKEAFYSRLNDEETTNEDYEHAKTVWKEFRIKTLGEYTSLYNKVDVLQLADVFENFSDMCLENYKLDPAWYYTSPGLACLQTFKEIYPDPRKFDLSKRKGVYPYDYVDSVDKLAETALPPKEAFYSRLNDEETTNEDYEHAKTVWKEFRIKTLGEYTSLYNKVDVLQLADVIENFSDICLENYKLDPAWYYTSPGLAWDAMLKRTGATLELLTDVDMLLMFKDGIRGGVATALNRLGQANNKYMGEGHDSSRPLKYIIYLDTNNLHGWSMSKTLPTHGFKWMDEAELKHWKSFSCILEVDLEYPESLHDPHNDYPLAPERVTVNKVDKLIPNLRDKNKYVVQYENLKLYERLGLKITKIHRGIKFEESVWLKE